MLQYQSYFYHWVLSCGKDVAAFQHPCWSFTYHGLLECFSVLFLDTSPALDVLDGSLPKHTWFKWVIKLCWSLITTHSSESGVLRHTTQEASGSRTLADTVLTVRCHDEAQWVISLLWICALLDDPSVLPVTCVCDIVKWFVVWCEGVSIYGEVAALTTTATVDTCC